MKLTASLAARLNARPPSIPPLAVKAVSMNIQSSIDFVTVYLLAAGRALVEREDDPEDVAMAGRDAVCERGGNLYQVFLALIARGYAEPLYVDSRGVVRETGNDLSVAREGMYDVVLTAAGRRAAAGLFRGSDDPVI